MNSNSGHGTPGKLLIAANRLIHRAQGIADDVCSVHDAILGSIMATEALELTCCYTPTTAIEALTLKHKFEVIVECHFVGVESNIKLVERLKEIDVEIAKVCQQFSKIKQEEARLNSKIQILSQLKAVFQEFNQFDEEQLCIGEMRSCYSTLWMRKTFFRRALIWPIRYIEMLLKSLKNFFLALVGWVFVLTFLFTIVSPSNVWTIDHLFIGLENAISSFFSIGPPIQHGAVPKFNSAGQVAVSILAMVSGFFHLGVFISHLYTIVTRR